MLHCKIQYAAMQTNGLHVASGIPKLALQAPQRHAVPPSEDNMSRTASLGLMPSASLLGRMMTAIDRLLMAHAELAIRNDDLPYPGL
jgi:hypothetical protein